MIYPREFFDLQCHVASRVATLAGIPLAEALLEYTNFYARFGLGREFAATHPVWRDYIEGVRRSAAPREWTYDFYLSRLPDRGAPDIVASVGCFSYARLDEASIRIHFHNAEASGISPLSAGRQSLRREELGELFEHVHRRESATVRVVGASWLYNLEAYRRLFPPAYLASAKVVAPRFKGMPLWGQFLDRRGAIRKDSAEALIRRLPALTGLDELAACFRYPVLALEAAATCFLPEAGPR